MPPRQLTFDLAVRPALGREDFFVSPSNALALATLDDWARWPGGKLVLVGPKGAGKTHLAHVWAKHLNAAILPATDVENADIPALAARGAVVIEDMDTPLTPPQEDALFHLHNLTLAEGGRLLFTALTPPARWPLALPDLASRMQGTTLARIDAPDDQLLGAMMLKLFADRQLSPAPAVIQWLIPRMTRSHAAVHSIVERLDAEALSTGRPITTALARQILDISAAPDDDVA